MAGVESKLQTKIKKELESNGWVVIKTILLSLSGFPDLFCFRKGVFIFLEIKAPNGKLSEVQKYRIEQIRKHDFIAETIYSYEQFKQLNL